MNVYWVADSYEWINELELVYLFASVKLWKHHHPHHKTILYTDEQSWEMIGYDGLWDEVIFYSFPNDITKEDGFWAAGKLQAMKEFQTPFCIMDLDVIYNGKVEFDREVISAHKELGDKYYIHEGHDVFKKTSIKPFSSSRNALNVSFLYIEEEKLHTEYVETSLRWMREFSENGYANGSLMTFCEQKLLMDIIERDEIEYRTLIQPEYVCKDREWDRDWLEEDKKYYHLQFDKRKADVNETFMLVQRGKILDLMNSVDSSLAKECFKYLKSKNKL